MHGKEKLYPRANLTGLMRVESGNATCAHRGDPSNFNVWLMQRWQSTWSHERLLLGEKRFACCPYFLEYDCRYWHFSSMGDLCYVLFSINSTNVFKE
jgi:hypothetical protein